LKRGEIWTVSGAGGYAGKPRPVLIVQDTRLAETNSLTVCGFTTDPLDAPLLRIAVAPSDKNGLREPCRLMIDKIVTVSKSNFGKRVGEIEDRYLAAFNSAIVVYLGVAG
jgi:mRNA interferase MazF